MRRFFSNAVVKSNAFKKASPAYAFRHHGGDCPEELHQNRAPKFATLNADDTTALKKIVGETNVFTDKDAMQPYMECWFHHYKAKDPKCAVFPKTTEEVSAILKYCNERKIAVVPQGGNTNFVGGAVPVFDEVVISMKRMDKILEVDEMSATVQCEAGVILETLDEYLKSKHGLMTPVDLGAKGSCFIGGNVSTNAGGVRYMRYGSLHGNTLGVKAVLANGDILDLLTTCKKDNTGYDLKQLFVGSEGTLGIITELALQLPPKPQTVQTMFLGLDSWENLEKTYLMARKQLGEILSAVEMIDGVALDMCIGINKDRSPLESGSHAYYLLLETNGSNKEHDSAKLESFLENSMETGLVSDGTLAENETKSKHIWNMREACAVAPNALGYVRWYDICMPASKMAELIEGTRTMIKESGMDKQGAHIIGFGHLGDGNLHLNLVCEPKYNDEVVKAVDGYIYSYAKERRYSVSAEHCIGVQKRAYLGYTKPENTVDMMKKMKHLFDPNGILNPYKIFDVSGAPPAQ